MRLPGGKELLFAAADAAFQWWQAYSATLEGKPRKSTKELAEISEQKQIPWIDSQELAAERVTIGLLVDLYEWMGSQGDLGAAHQRALARYAKEEIDFDLSSIGGDL